MILLDADVVLIDRKYTADSRYSINRAALARLIGDGQPRGMVAHAVLEVVGVLSHGTATADVPFIPDALRKLYGITIVPMPAAYPDYALCTFDDLIKQMSLKMSLGDAVMAVQVARFAPAATALVTWNAKHFRGKVVVPVHTPADWLQQQPPAGSASARGAVE